MNGYLTSETLAYGFITPFMLFAFGLTFMPWTRIAKTRLHCLGYWLVSALTIGATLAVHGLPHPMFLALATWGA